MADLTVREFDDYAEFVQEWHAGDPDAPLEEPETGTSSTKTRRVYGGS